jgi:hypothetical protein
MTFTTPYRAIFAADGAVLDAAQAVEACARPSADFTSYESSSLFVAVIDRAGALRGSARVIVPSPTGFKTLHDAGKGPAGLDLARTWDVASFNVRPGAGDLVTATLCHVVFQALRVNRIRTVVLNLDQPTRKTFAAFGLLPAPIGGSATAVWGRVGRLVDRQRATCWEGYRLVTQGVGLDGVRLPHPGELEIRISPRAGLSWGRALAPTG